MGLFSWLRRKTASAFSMVINNAFGGHFWSSETSSRVADEAYKKNVIAYSAISAIAKAVASIDTLIYSDKSKENELDNSSVADALETPNDMQTQEEFTVACTSYFLLYGNCYIYAPQSGSAIELWPLNPSRVTPKPNEAGNAISHYEYRTDRGNRKLPAEDVLHWKTFNPDSMLIGQAPLLAASLALGQHNASGEHNYNLLKNGASPRGAFIVTDPNSPNGVPTQATPEQRKQLRDGINKEYAGPANSGKPMLVEGNLRYEAMGFTMQEMDFLDLSKMSARYIAIALGYPPLLAGLEDATYANAEEAKLALYTGTVIPLARAFFRQLNKWLVPKLGGNQYIAGDEASIPAIKAAQIAMWAALAPITFLTVDEKRNEAGFDDYEPTGKPGGYLTEPAGQLPLEADREEDEPELEPEDAGAQAFGAPDEKPEDDEGDDDGEEEAEE